MNQHTRQHTKSSRGRKRRCQQCGRFIVEGERYEITFDLEERQEWRAHVACNLLWHECNDALKGWLYCEMNSIYIPLWDGVAEELDGVFDVLAGRVREVCK